MYYASGFKIAVVDILHIIHGLSSRAKTWSTSRARRKIISGDDTRKSAGATKIVKQRGTCVLPRGVVAQKEGRATQDH